MKLELANFFLDRVSMYVAPYQAASGTKDERNWSFEFESGKLQLGAKKREPCGIQHNARHQYPSFWSGRDIAGRYNRSLTTFGTWVMLCQGFLPAATLASRNERRRGANKSDQTFLPASLQKSFVHF